MVLCKPKELIVLSFSDSPANQTSAWPACVIFPICPEYSHFSPSPLSLAHPPPKTLSLPILLPEVRDLPGKSHVLLGPGPASSPSHTPQRASSSPCSSHSSLAPLGLLLSPGFGPCCPMTHTKLPPPGCPSFHGVSDQISLLHVTWELRSLGPFNR